MKHTIYIGKIDDRTINNDELIYGSTSHDGASLGGQIVASDCVQAFTFLPTRLVSAPTIPSLCVLMLIVLMQLVLTFLLKTSQPLVPCEK